MITKLLKETEDKITYARQFYNDTAMSFNDLVEMFPSNIVASIFGFKKYEFFEASEKEKVVGNYIISNGLSSFVEGLNIGYNATYTETTIQVLKDAVVNDVTVYPMIRLASDTDNTYQPYSKTNQQLTKETSAMLENIHNNGAVNLAPSKAESKTLHYITYTVGSDGVIDANGTSDTNTSDYIIFSNVTFKAGKYIILGTGTDNIRVQITNYPITSELAVAGTNNGVLTLYD